MHDRKLVAGDCFAITKNNSTMLPERCCGIYVGSTGDVAVETESGKQVTFVGVPTGGIIPIAARKVLSTGTTASSIVGFLS